MRRKEGGTTKLHHGHTPRSSPHLTATVYESVRQLPSPVLSCCCHLSCELGLLGQGGSEEALLLQELAAQGEHRAVQPHRHHATVEFVPVKGEHRGHSVSRLSVTKPAEAKGVYVKGF
jgi:hypothetical protein